MDKNKVKITVGLQIGKLTIAEPTNQRKNAYMVWKCRCECENEILVDTRVLQRGTVTDCGCTSKTKTYQKDLTNQKFGLLTPLNPTNQRAKNGGIIWNCKCDCGNECTAVSTSLLQGIKKSCGCLSHPDLKDYIGKTFGELEVIEYAGKRDGMHRWKCICSCGKETIVGQTLLQTGKTKSCGH